MKVYVLMLPVVLVVTTDPETSCPPGKNTLIVLAASAVMLRVGVGSLVLEPLLKVPVSGVTLSVKLFMVGGFGGVSSTLVTVIATAWDAVKLPSLAITVML